MVYKAITIRRDFLNKIICKYEPFRRTSTQASGSVLQEYNTQKGKLKWHASDSVPATTSTSSITTLANRWSGFMKKPTELPAGSTERSSLSQCFLTLRPSSPPKPL